VRLRRSSPADAAGAVRWSARLAGVLAVATLALSGCGGATPAASPTAPTGARPGDVAPALAGTSLEGHAVSLSALHGSVVVVVFWASWCAPCQAEQPAINTLAREEAAGGVRFIGVSVDVDRSAALGYVSRFAPPYDSLIDTAQAVVVEYDVAGPPTTFVIDPAGRVSAELVGEVSTDDLRARVDAARSAR
jgi:cytochrome c biogenesis protein CcmG/thiol:disulfide interchange protein DsbE